MAKQAIKKGAMTKRAGLSAFKEKVGLNASNGTVNTTISNANKTQTWIIMPKAYQEATKLPGIPENFLFLPQAFYPSLCKRLEIPSKESSTVTQDL